MIDANISSIMNMFENNSANHGAGISFLCPNYES